MAKSLVIVGGGFLGAELAKGLEESFDVTLVEPREAFVHAPAMLRALVDSRVRDAALIPYDKLLKKGRVVAAKATEIRANGVVAGGEEIAADFIVLATGSRNGGIFKPGDEGIQAFRAAQAKVSTEIAEAARIVIVGAGAVGTELAGEIAHAHPKKTITLVSSGEALFPGFAPKLGQTLRTKLTKMGVNVVLGARVTDLKSTTEPYGGAVTLSTGQMIEADLVIPAIGSKPQTALFEGLPGASHVKDGRVNVDAYLRPCDHPNIYAAGDAVDAGDAMTVVATSRQQPWLAAHLKKRAGGATAETQKAYTPWGKAPILIPLGPDNGSSFLIVATFGDWITGMLKGRDLFITKYRKLFGYG